MTEKVLHEVRFIETDDGFRIEVKGDKEKIRRMGFGPGWSRMGFGPGRHHGGHCGHGRHRHHHEGQRHGRKGWGWWWDNVDDEEEVATMKEKSPADI